MLALKEICTVTACLKDRSWLMKIGPRTEHDGLPSEVETRDARFLAILLQRERFVATALSRRGTGDPVRMLFARCHGFIHAHTGGH